MRLQSRLFLSSMLLPATALLGAGTAANAQSMWSDPATWPSGEVPGEGDAVTITRDMDVVLDQDAPGLRSLTIQGSLTFSDERDISLSSEWIYVPGGSLTIGTADNPYQHNASITLTDDVTGEDINTMGDRGIMLMQGTLNLHGNREHTWSKLSATVEAGSTSFTVLDASGWRAGDEVVLASTDFNPRQAERRTVTAVNGNTVTVDAPFEYMHFGEITFGVDERGEVANLTRNIRIQASDDAAYSHFGGHIMAMSGAELYIDSVELARMGQHLTLARYPIHFHILGEGAGQYVRNASIHDTFNRCVTVHGTDNLEIENNVTYNTVGHCFFLEDGIEQGNRFERNLAIQTKCHPTLDCIPTNLAANGENNYTYENRMAVRAVSFGGGGTLLPSDNTVASYWITNPNNHYIDNVAAGSDQNGFWLSLPEHPNGAHLGTEAALNTWPRRMPLGEFRGNVAHSNFDGFMFDRNINEDNTFGLAGNAFMPRVDPSDPDSPFVETLISDLTSYKNRNGGLWGRGELMIFDNMKFADNAIGMTISSGDFGSQAFTSRLQNSLVVGETDNVGNPTTAQEIAHGRSLPKIAVPDFPIRGYEYYDYRNEVVDTTFVNYQDNDVRKTGALSWLLFTSSGVTTASTIEGAEFVDAKPVYFPPITLRFDNDNRGGVAYRTLSIHDLDGSVTGIPDSHIMLHDGENNSVVTDESCEIHPDWNASVCTGDVGRLYLAQRNGRIGAQTNIPQPISLMRNGTEFNITGNQSTVKAGTEVQVVTERPEVTLSVSEMDEGSWVVLELPGFANADTGTEQSSMAALRAANETSYFRDGDTLWVKLVAGPPEFPIRPLNMQASITASREGLGG